MSAAFDRIGLDDAARQVLPLAAISCNIEDREDRMGGKGCERINGSVSEKFATGRGEGKSVHVTGL
jgi:hypothetical protein